MALAESASARPRRESTRILADGPRGTAEFAERERTCAALATRGYHPSPDEREQLRQRFETRLAAIQRQETGILARTMQTSA